MANVTISDLTAATAVDGTELIEIEQDGVSKQATAADIAALGGGGGGSGTVDTTGTPVANQVAIWTDSNTLKGTTGITVDSSGNLYANNFGSGYTTTASAASTTILTLASDYQQYFTGSTTQTCRLPVASTLTLGHRFFIANTSTGDLTVQSSGLVTVVVLGENESAMLTCILASGTGATSWTVVTAQEGGGAGTVDTTGTPVAAQIPIWTDADTLKGQAGLTADSSSNLSANNFVTGYTTTATAAGTTTLTVASTGQQFFTGATTQTVKLPVTSTLTLGHQFFIFNDSTGTVTVQSSGANDIVALTEDIGVLLTCILASGTTAASWHALTTEDVLVSDTAYDATTWNGDTTTAPSKNALRDKFETLTGGGNVSNVGTPVSGQLASWTGATTIQGSTAGTGVVTALGVSTNATGGFPTTDGTATLTNKTIDMTSNTVKVYTVTVAGNTTLTAAECYGGVIYVNASVTITLPSIVAGMSVTIIANAAVTVNVDPNTTQIIRLDGTALSGGFRAYNPLGEAGDLIVFTYYGVGTWYAASNGWSDAGS